VQAVDDIIRTAIKAGTKDDEVYAAIHKCLWETYGHVIPSRFRDLSTEERGTLQKKLDTEQTIRDRKREMRMLKLIPRSVKAFFGNNFRILDIGCSEGKRTAEKANFFGLPADRCFGLDVRQVMCRVLPIFVSK